MNRRVPLASGVALLAFLCAWTLDARARQNLLFAYFTGNGDSGLHLARSEDGLTWAPLREGKPFLAPAVGGKLMRDPHVLLGPDGRFHMVWTTGWWDRGIGLAHSADLVEWSEQVFLPVMDHEPKAVNCWAPELFYDELLQQYMIIWSTTIPGRFPATDHSGDRGPDGVELNHRIYVTTTRDFESYAPAELLFDPGFNAIDATLLRDGARVVMFLKDETKRPEPKKLIRMAVADRARGPYRIEPDPLSPDWVEGPTALRVGRDLFLYFDAYTRRRFEGVKSRDLRAWTPITDDLRMPDGARHGTAFAVSDKVMRRLAAARD